MAGTTTVILRGRRKCTQDAPPERDPTPPQLAVKSLLWQAVLTPSFTGFKNRCLLCVSVTNTVLHKLKCWTQTMSVLLFRCWTGLNSQQFKFLSFKTPHLQLTHVRCHWRTRSKCKKHSEQVSSSVDYTQTHNRHLQELRQTFFAVSGKYAVSSQTQLFALLVSFQEILIVNSKMNSWVLPSKSTTFTWKDNNPEILDFTLKHLRALNEACLFPL